MKVFFVSIFIFLGFIFPSATLASHIELRECIEIAHCVREEWDVSSIEQPFKEIRDIIKNTPRSVIVELDGDYLHAEVTSKWMKYVDDLEVSFIPETSKLLVRSESRVGESDLGVNQKRVNLLKSKVF
ncbi:Uncharacterized protein conserved in bacteria [Prochlorococcus marinus str. MIT 9515]|uniref:Uncharacterized protein conserved in bacteria n=1 Tax=Prochlorococcus marinus (strain MIT 9515) TaxID=167542 RepID=A2BX14_PROM5|nr:DUF1499 domain-containing protein [Prochlorococcus marinus]ABM72325.1 Uncharacterized protein conserved in bacteria [Prochlorococcus marinus str. MIT 9515]